MALLSQLLWKEKFDRIYQEKIQNLPARDTREYMDHEEDYEASYAMSLKATKSVFVRKGLEIAVIANPDNGSNFFRLCISFPSWGERGCQMTTFRVSEIARANITSQEKCRLLGLLASGDAALKEAGIPSNEKPFSQWLRMNVYWWQLERWWLGYILKVSRFPIPEHPSIAWVDSEREETGIYPEDWIDDLQGTDAWRDCPWFLDYADGEFPDVEEGAYHAHHKKVKGKGKSSSATINQPKDAHSPSTAKGRPPRTTKGRPSTSKKHPRPAVSESSESLEEQFELLSREDAEDSRHADSKQQSDSRRSSPSGRSRSQGLRRSSPSRQSRSQGSRWSSPAQGSRSRDSRTRTSDTARSHPSEFLLDDGTLVVACRAEHLFKVISEACEFQFCHIRTLFLRMPSHTYVMDYDFTDPVATLIVVMFVRDLDGPLPVPFYDRRAGDIAADIDGYEADSDMLQEPLRESSWTLDTSGAAFRSGVEKSEFFARWLIGTFTTVEELERATSLKSPAQPSIPHFYPPPTPQPPDIAQWPYGPSYPPPYTFMKPHSAWPPVMGGRPPLQRPLFAPPPMEPPPPPSQYPPPPPSQL
ncbi:hypothetical protein L7F22_048078 [Adiantum nelumboides]|nr:hypothetical protein [Adiantum nelumboides]